MLSYRQRLQDRIVAGDIAIDTTNKIIRHVAGMFGAINDVNQFGLPAIFAKARISGGKDKQGVAFDPAFVQEQILADAACGPEGRGLGARCTHDAARALCGEPEAAQARRGGVLLGARPSPAWPR